MRIQNMDRFKSLFWTISIVIIEMSFFIFQQFIMYLVQVNRKYEAVLYLLVYGFSLVIFIVMSRDRFRTLDVRSERDLNSKKRLNIFSSHVVGGWNLGIEEHRDRNDVAKDALEYLNSPELRNTFTLLDAFLRYSDRKTVEGMADVLESEGLIDGIDDAEIDEQDKEFMTNFITGTISRQEGNKELITFNRRMNEARVDWDRIPLQELVARRLQSFFPDNQIAKIHDFIDEKGVDTEEDDLVDLFIDLSKKDLIQLVAASPETWVTVEHQKSAAGIDGKNATEIAATHINEIRMWLKYSIDAFTLEEMQFFFKHKILTMKDLRLRKEDSQLERAYNASFRESRGKKVESNEINEQKGKSDVEEKLPPAKAGRVQQAFSILREKLYNRSQYRWVSLCDLVDDWTEMIVSREADLNLKFNNDRRSQIFNARRIKNFGVQYAEYRSIELVFDSSFFVRDLVARPNGEVEESRVQCMKAHFLSPSAFENVFVGEPQSVTWDGRSGLICTDSADITVLPVFWFKEKEPVFLIVFSKWHEEYGGDLLKQLTLQPLFKKISEAFVSRIKDAELRNQELVQESEMKDDVIQSNKSLQDQGRLIKTVQKGLDGWNDRLKADWRLFRLPVGWIVVIIGLIAVFSWASFMAGKNT